MKKKKFTSKKKDSSKKETSSEKVKNVWSIVLILCLALVARVLTRTFVSLSENRTRVESQQVFEKKTDSVVAKVNDELNKYDSIEEASNSLMNRMKDGKTTEIGIVLGFLHQRKVIRDFCEPSGYVPEKFISGIAKFKTGTDYDEEFVNVFLNEGLSREQSGYLLYKMKETLTQQILRLLEVDYQSVLKVDKSFSKKEYCKSYDEYAEEIIADKLERIRKAAPNAYEKYFQKQL